MSAEKADIDFYGAKEIPNGLHNGVLRSTGVSVSRRPFRHITRTQRNPL